MPNDCVVVYCTRTSRKEHEVKTGEKIYFHQENSTRFSNLIHFPTNCVILNISVLIFLNTS